MIKPKELALSLRIGYKKAAILLAVSFGDVVSVKTKDASTIAKNFIACAVACIYPNESSVIKIKIDRIKKNIVPLYSSLKGSLSKNANKETENERINITSFEAIEIDAENTIKKRSFIKGFNLHRNESLILVEKITTSSMINP